MKRINGHELDRITIRGFKSIRELDNFELNNLNIFIDEPELGLHPLAISILAELIQDAANRTQVIVATQSPSLINNFSIDDIVVVRRKNSASSFERLNAKEFKVWLEEYSAGDLWEMNVIQGGPTIE